MASIKSGTTPEYPAADPKAYMVAEGFASTAEACKYLSISRAKLYSMMEQKELMYAKFGKSRRIPWQSLRELAARSLVG